ncbi:hypothetical protein ACAG96_08040 [Candidatus Izemoplasma sp. B36]|uniref:hypothetical protein n=1 Tax=Candidatus Izemoplasma sp. B36 TaxID=3242468 RepID=UPI003557CC2A
MKTKSIYYLLLILGIIFVFVSFLFLKRPIEYIGNLANNELLGINMIVEVIFFSSLFISFFISGINIVQNAIFSLIKDSSD